MKKLICLTMCALLILCAFTGCGENSEISATATPTASATATATAKSTAKATAKATAKPTAKPTQKPTPKPTATPTPKPTATPRKTPNYVWSDAFPMKGLIYFSNGFHIESAKVTRDDRFWTKVTLEFIVLLEIGSKICFDVYVYDENGLKVEDVLIFCEGKAGEKTLATTIMYDYMLDSNKTYTLKIVQK